MSGEGLSLDARRPLVGTWALVAVVLAAHAGSGLALWLDGADPLTAWVLDRGVEARVAVGGQHQRPLADGQWWRLWTSVLLHGDALHLGMNAVSLYALGRLLEPALGATRWLGWFTVGGVSASLGCWAVGVVQSDGASGGAFALLAAGVWLGLAHRRRWDPADRRLMGPVLAGFLLANFALGCVIPGIDAIAHAFGVAAGLLLAALDPVTRSWRGAYGVAAVGAALVCAVGWLTLAL